MTTHDRIVRLFNRAITGELMVELRWLARRHCREYIWHPRTLDGRTVYGKTICHRTRWHRGECES
jgi:hypothetical protein